MAAPKAGSDKRTGAVGEHRSTLRTSGGSIGEIQEGSRKSWPGGVARNSAGISLPKLGFGQSSVQPVLVEAANQHAAAPKSVPAAPTLVRLRALRGRFGPSVWRPPPDFGHIFPTPLIDPHSKLPRAGPPNVPCLYRISTLGVVCSRPEARATGCWSAKQPRAATLQATPLADSQ